MTVWLGRVGCLLWLCTGVAWCQPASADAVAFAHQPVVFTPHVFSSDVFPPCDFVDSLLARQRIGPYTIETVFYDQNYRPVTVPMKAGRYGAVVTVRASSGQTYRRFRTLYRHSAPVDWDPASTVPLVDLPFELGVDPTVVAEQSAALSMFVTRQLVRGLSLDAQAGALFAGLHELIPGTGSVGGTAYLAGDRTWWVGLKRRLYGLPSVPEFDAPIAVYRGLAPELRLGSPAEAGVRETVSSALDSVVQVLQSDTDEPVSLCIARNGVIFYYRAFGRFGSYPMTLATRTPLAEVTEVLSGIALMTLVDQKRIDLDAPVSRYLVPFRGTSLEKTLTVRHLVTHTSGLEDEWGDEANDLEERVAGFADHVKVGEGRLGGTGRTGMALVGKVIEAVSGQPLHEFYRDHLLDPLECDETEIFGTSDDAWSRPLELARLGQLMLNAGSYGDFLFYEPETAQAMMPIDGHAIGVGIVEAVGEGLGSGAFGRDGSSGTSLRVAPQSELVVALHRFSAGVDDAEHRALLFQTIVEHLLPDGS